MSDEYYTLQEVIEKLGKSRSTVIRDTNAGKIPSEGKKRRRRYPKEAIDAIAAIEQKKKKTDKKAPRLIFSPSTPKDLWTEVVIGKKLYGEDDIVPYKQLLEWREVNDEMYMSIKENGDVVAYSSLMPLEQDVILALLEDKFRERDIPLGAIRQWTDPRLSVYIASITIKPTDSKQRKRELGGMLIRRTVKWALSLDRQADIKHWYGIGATEEGQRLFERLGFSVIMSLYNGERKGYYLDDVKKPVRVINQILREMSHDLET